MPYCIHCGREVHDTDHFCRGCGRPQPAAAAGGASAGGLSPRGASMLCYVPWLGFIGSIIVLAGQTFRNHADVRFHAYQGLYIFVTWLLVRHVAGLWSELLFFGKFLPVSISGILQMAVVALWIFMLFKAANEQRYSLPLLGELAERSL